jgi:D-alanyl-D-alanine carboxypeptidase
MVISRDQPAFRRKPGTDAAAMRFGPLMQLAMFVLLVTALSIVPAEAKKKKYRYSPPQSAIVVDLHTGKVLYQQNADEARFPASITKVMTLYLLFEQIRSGHMTLDTKLMVSKEAASRPPSKLGLKPGSSITVNDAMHALVTKSANDVAATVAENIAGSEPAFARMMTYKARSIGMAATTFKNASGLPDPEQRTTARDLITLGRHVLKDFPEKAKLFQTRYFQYGKRRFRSHNRLLFSYKGMEGMKTGFIRASGFNLLASSRRDQKHLLAVVLGGRSSKHRNARMRSLLDQSWGKAVAMKDLKKRGSPKPMTIAGIARPDLLPERNPAFHDIPAETDVAEQVLEVTIRKELGVASKAGGEKAAPRLALANASVSPVLKARIDAEEEAQGDSREDDEESSLLAEEKAQAFGPYHVQVGSFLDTQSAQALLTKVSAKASSLLSGHKDFTVSGDVKGKSYYRARYGAFSEKDAASTCSKLKKMKIDCLVVRVD